MKSKTTHETIWELLPWFVNNSLETSEHRQVALHVTQCTLCQSEIRVQQRLQKQLLASETFPDKQEKAYQRVLEQIHNVTPIKKLNNKQKYFKFQPVPLSLVASLFVAIVAGALFMGGEQQKNYSTLTDSGYSQNNSGQFLARVIFKQRTSQQKIKSLLAAYRAKIVAGPDVRGIYTVDFSDKMSVETRFNKLLSKLQQHNEILLVTAITKTSKLK